MALLRTADGRMRVIDGHSYAPRRVSVATVTKEQQQRGHRSCTIPSAPATLQHLHRKYGRLAWLEVLAPATTIAQEGFAITPLQRKQAGWVKEALRGDRAACELFLRSGEAPAVGETLRQPRLAATLERIASAGAEDFYRGELARDIADDMRAHGGLLDEEDLASFSGPIEREPLCSTFRGLEVVTVPPPGGGLQLLVALKLLERLTPLAADPTPDAWYAAIALATYGAFRARELDPVLPEEMTSSVGRRLLGDERIAELLHLLQRSPSPEAAACEEPGDTTHLTAADAEGNVVALTLSIQSVFGAKVANEKLGFLYNNYLRTCPRDPHPFQLAPRCLSRSNASPVLILANAGGERRPVLALGSAGSRRITSSLLQVTSNVVDRGMSIEEAIDAPRVHALLNRKVWVESRIASSELTRSLRPYFTRFVTKAPYSFAMGAVHALELHPGATLPGADPRRDGAGAVLPVPTDVRA